MRCLLPEVEAAGEEGARLELLTQIARALGLQRKFPASHAVLDEVEGALTDVTRTARIRYLLERGRAWRTGGEPEKGLGLFLEAFELAREAGADFYAVDAAHMLGVDPGEESLAWNERAMALAEGSSQEAAQSWLGSLYNNIAWTHHGLGNLERALEIHRQGLAWQEERGRDAQACIARWCIGHTLRGLGRVEEALATQRELAAWHQEAGTEDGYVQEELGECLHALGREEEATPHFAQAHSLLNDVPRVAQDEPERLARLARLGGIGEG